jgi:3-hydroxyisobutyrate dehydrogenase-like beta-hydroxyacid dehydrogenase|tara:strand:+ start:1505 stop:1765 length:261 start_codon:yes stop_codon:yes gene_type:complete
MTHIALIGTALLDEANDHQLLTRGIELEAWNCMPERNRKLLGAGAVQIRDLNEVGDKWDVLITVLPKEAKKNPTNDGCMDQQKSRQ